MKKRLERIFDNVFPIFLAFALIFGMPTYVFRCVRVSGKSMEPTYYNNDMLFADKISHYVVGYHRGDIVYAKLNHTSALDGEYIIKRVIGVPGDTVQIIDDKIYINGEVWDEDIIGTCGFAGIAEDPITLGEDEYFLMGDNRTNSLDSRSERIGVVHRDEIEGVIRFKMFHADFFF